MIDNIGNLTFIELMKLNNQVSIEVLKRIWPIFPIFIVIFILLGVYDKRGSK